MTSVHLRQPAPALPALRASRGLFSDAEYADMRAYFAGHPALTPTPLHRLAGLAANLGLRAVWVKDETSRFGLNAFKSLGARFAIDTLVTAGRLATGDTIVCASEGNHGRAVARAARESGCLARVYVAASVAQSRIDAIRAEGATIVLVEGGYDDAVMRALADADARGWTIVSDTSWQGDEAIPRLIMLGYTRMMDEVVESRGGDWRPTAVFVPGGVGGLLAAVSSWVAAHWHNTRPHVIAVEPASAASLQASARAGHPVIIDGPFPTKMAGLRCGTVSPLAFEAAQTTVSAYIAIDDTWAERAMRELARPVEDDERIHCGAAGAAALGGALAVIHDPAANQLRRAIPLDSAAEILVIVSEGVTDPAVWEAVVTTS